MDICTAFIADPQPTKLSTPSVGPFYDPAVPTETILRLDPASGDARFDPSASAGAAAPGIVVSFVGVQLGRAAARPAARPGNRQHAIEQLLQDLRIVNVGSRQAHGQRNALSIDEKMMLRARFALVRRVGTRRSAPFFAATVAESTAARLQSMSPPRPNSSRRTWCRRSQTPARCHSWSRRQQVIPLPHPISGGSISQGIPLRSTNKIPVNAARSGTRGRPPFGFSFSGGSSGTIRSHNSSLKRGRMDH